MIIFLISLVFIAIIAIEAPGLVKKRKWRDLAAFTVLLLIGMVYSFGEALDLPMPNPTRGIMAIFEPLSRYLEKILMS